MSVGSIGQQIINGTYGLDNRPPTAYEELKAWCEKYLNPTDYSIAPETENYCQAIYLHDIWADLPVGVICFEDNKVTSVSTIPYEDMKAHLNEEREQLL